MGTVNDWKLIKIKLVKLLDFKDRLNQYNIQKWFDNLNIFIDNCILSIEGCGGDTNIDYWKKFIVTLMNLDIPEDYHT
ncbi:hypothetical protein [Trichoplusia ni ascovirus 2c]|uniref:hypothetical protein n=1 Tax=Trichoplusia ni ascovirus 2c TaxID=328615 RepID=UPI0000E441E7|nr:hypothetical protein TNAV2c_gp015 [Trichoplusia ni ascovirus 2c]ABF70532.1 hypothetical protein [Trichoplusia ni ascovirus 2c]